MSTSTPIPRWWPAKRPAGGRLVPPLFEVDPLECPTWHGPQGLRRPMYLRLMRFNLETREQDLYTIRLDV